jgi:hypothetical protein
VDDPRAHHGWSEIGWFLQYTTIYSLLSEIGVDDLVQNHQHLFLSKGVFFYPVATQVHVC